MRARAIAAALVLVAGAASAAGAQSLYREGNAGSTLFADLRARSVGDLVTILVVEQSTSSRSANTTTTKETSRSAAVTQFPTMLDPWANLIIKPIVKNWLPGGYKPPSQWFEDQTAVGIESKADHTGKGNIDRTDRVTGQLAARVVKVLDNGNMVIEGRRSIDVNDETQIMALSGIIRPQDVNANNSVLSTQIADAQLQVVGRGILGDVQRPGFIFRFLDWLNLF